MANIQYSETTTKKTVLNRFSTDSETVENRFTPKAPPPLGNITSYFANQQQQGIPKTEQELLKLKYAYKKAKIERKKKIGKLVDRVSYCGTRCICKDANMIQAVEGEKGGIYYQGMQRCGSVWFCPDCMYKLMKARAEELYKQLQIYKKKDKTVLFLTFTLQHSKADRLADLHNHLLSAFQFANSHRKWKEAKKKVPVEYLRALEVLNGSNGWHPHLHCLFVGDAEITETIQIFVDLYKQELSKRGLLVNNHTVTVDKWNGTLETMTDYLFKGMIEKEITGGNLTKSGKGQNFFELVDDDNKPAIAEYIKVMKGKRQYHKSKHFFDDVVVQTEEEILKDDVAAKALFVIPIEVYADIHKKGIALHLLNEYAYGGKERAIKLLDLYDCDSGFFDEYQDYIKNGIKTG